ncbi:hypothetical protein [Haloprofundus salilacus]|uniref:hypothetical protein n=1 Tax=Haloprofundus salilacus TaxID=2876190 RepID=UPI001CCC16F8|nr:hypothetical protein [Haloprofundus salilacus]
MTKRCSICDQALDENPLSGPTQVRQHRNQFERIVGRRPKNYDEVRETLADNGDILTLDDF